MNEDEQLKSVLTEWKAPAPGAELDERVRRSVQRSVRMTKPRRTWMWLAIAAGIVLIAAIGHMGRNDGEAKSTLRDSSGFQPLVNGAITTEEGTQ